MRIRVIVADEVVRDLKVPKDQRNAFADGIADLERKRDEWMQYSMSFSVGDLELNGMLESIEHTKDNGEEIIVFRF